MRMGALWLVVVALLSVLQGSEAATEPRQAFRADYEWYREQTASAYEKVGSRNPKWDNHATEMLLAYSRMHSQQHSYIGDENDVIRAAGIETRKANCDDALVLHITARNLAYRKLEASEVADYTFRAVSALRNSKYHAVFKCYSLLRAAELKARATENIAGELKEARAMMSEAVSLVGEVASDPRVPRRVIFNLLESVGEASKVVTNDRETYAAPAGKLLDEKCKDRSLVLAVTAEFHTSHAWDARGGGFADTVSDQQAKLMQARLELAAAAAEAAFEIDPKNVLAPLTMLNVELGQGEGRPRMEQWFERAVAADPGCYSAYTRKLYYLEPKWHGTPQAMVAFGQECLRSGDWDTGIPLVLIEAHLDLARYTDTGYQPRPEPDYFKNPRAWADIKAAYEPFIERNPHLLYHRSRYAEIACWAGDWKTAHAQFKAMGDKISYEYFRNRAAYRRVRAEVESKLAQPSK